MPDKSLVRFRRVVAASLAALESRRDEVNDLNVFPVADGDTGDNMAMTLRAVLTELDGLGEQPLDVIGREELVSAVARVRLHPLSEGRQGDQSSLISDVGGPWSPVLGARRRKRLTGEV